MNTVAFEWASQDAGTLSWLAVAGYLVGAALCVRQVSGAPAGRERLFWLLAALAMLALGFNKQLDLHTQLTAFGRQMARDGGWFEHRRRFQAAFIVVIAVAGLLVSGWLVWLVRGLRTGVMLALAGLVLLAVFVLVRASSIHHVDVAMRTPVLGLKLHTVLEQAGIAIVIIGALLPRRRALPAQ